MEPVQPYTTTLNSANTYWMAHIAKAVYTRRTKKNPAPNEEKILKNLQKQDPAFRSVTGYSKNSAQAALIEHADYFCMAFRGTDELSDWLDNVNVFSEEVLFGHFHRGFWRSLNDVWEGMFEAYEKLMAKKKRPIFLTGHSLGGAMATVAAAKLVHQDIPFTSVYTFGQPRVMTRDTSRIFNVECKGRFFRFQNNNDLVTRVPARLMGYSHVGSFLYISQEERLHNDPGYWFRFLDYIDGAFDDALALGLDGIKDHDMANYLKAIKKWDCDF
ncbi:MAG: Mbeg1-like protein [Nitrospiria bacterium]